MSSSNAVVSTVNARLFATEIVAAVLFAAKVTAGDAPVSIVADSDVWVVIVVAYEPAVAVFVIPVSSM